MSRISDTFRNVCRGLAGSLRDYPLEALLGVTYFLIFIFGKDNSALAWFFPHYVLLYTLHKFGRKNRIMTVLYILAWFLWIPLVLWGTKDLGWNLGMAYFLALILLFIGEKPLDNESYGRNILDVALKVALGFAIGALLMGIVSAIIASVNFLFDLHLKDEWFSYPNAFIALVVIPLLCCWSVNRPPSETKDNKILQIVVDYILSPALVIYAAILLVYIIRILFRWELPNGGVAYLVLSFLGISLLCYLFRLQLEKRHFEWFYKYLPAISLPPVILLWTGIFRRVGDYGLTEARFYLMVLAALATIFLLMLTKEKSRNFQLMTLILAAAAVLFTYVPGIRAKDFGVRSQRNRPAEEQAVQEDKAAAEFEKLTWSFNDIDSPLDIGEYTLLVPRSDYHYYEDSSQAIFYKDETRTEPLLECNILEMLDAAGKDPVEKLVYRNDRYMAVFNSIEDRRGYGDVTFLANGAMLFRKPQ